MLLFAAVVTMATGLLFGLFPALHSSRPDLQSIMKGHAGQPSGARAAARFRTTLATAQIALSMALLVAAGLFTKSLLNVTPRRARDSRSTTCCTFGVSPELNGYTNERSRLFFERLEEELAALPGVTAVTASLVPAIAGSNWGTDVSVQGFKGGPDVDANSRFNEVGPGYFRTMGIPILAGREFTPADSLKAPKVAIVNEAFAKKFNLGRDAVGKLMGNDTGNNVKLDIEIVGLAQNAKYSEVKDEIPPLFFRPYRQDDSLGFINVLRADVSVARSVVRSRPPGGGAARSEPSARGSQDDAAAGARQRVPGPLHQRPVGRVRDPGDAARGRRSLRSSGLHRRAANARDRTAHGARRGAGPRAGHAAQAGRDDDARRRGDRTRRRVVLGRLAESQLYQLQGRDPVMLAASAVILGSSRSRPASSPRTAPHRSTRCGRCDMSRPDL